MTIWHARFVTYSASGSEVVRKDRLFADRLAACAYLCDESTPLRMAEWAGDEKMVTLVPEDGSFFASLIERYVN